jgi:hypothetical protein
MRPSFALPSLGVTVPRSNALISAKVIRLSWSRLAAQSISASPGTALTLLAGMGPRSLVLRFWADPVAPFRCCSQGVAVMFTGLDGELTSTTESV